MNATTLSQGEFAQVVRCCQRVLINESTCIDDLKHYLVARLRDTSPTAAANIERLSGAQAHDLIRDVLAALETGQN
jgi:hypothetical protein